MYMNRVFWDQFDEQVAIALPNTTSLALARGQESVYICKVSGS